MIHIKQNETQLEVNLRQSLKENSTETQDDNQSFLQVDQPLSNQQGPQGFAWPFSLHDPSIYSEPLCSKVNILVLSRMSF